MDQPKIERMLRLMKLMSGSVDYSITELSEKLDISYRSIYRYIDTFKSAGFVVEKIGGNTYKLCSMPRGQVDFSKLIYFSEEEAYIVNGLIDRLDETNALKVNLKKKLSAIYGSTSIADYVDKRSNASAVAALGEAVNSKLKVTLKDYESGHSHTVRDRHVEPFGFTTNYIDVWALDLEDGVCKTFKIARIGDVEMSEDPWTEESRHERSGVDIFRMAGREQKHVRLRLSVRAKNLILEEYPLSERDLVRDGSDWVLDTQVYDYAGVCRFYIGLSNEIQIMDSPEFEAYVDSFVEKNLLHRD